MLRARRRLACAWHLLASILMLASFSYSQSATSVGSTEDDQQNISQLLQQIKDLQQQARQLQERVELLEARQKTVPASTAPGASAPPTPPPQTSTQTSTQVQVEATSEPSPDTATPSLPDMHDAHGIQWRGFAEVDYKALNQSGPETGTYGFVPGSAADFYTGDFDLFLTSSLTARTRVISEIDFEEGDAQSYKVDLRRLLLKIDLNDHLRISLGRFQTSIGYYNWAFRSASWLQTTADRPLVMEYSANGGVLPTQAVGISVTGTVPSGKLGLNYVAEYGSSDTIRPDINGDGLLNDENNGNAINVGFYLRPDYVAGLQLGGSFYHDHISHLQVDAITGVQLVQATDSERWKQSIVNGYAVYVSKGIEFLNEGFLIRHSPIQNSSLENSSPDESIFNTSAFYSQLSKKLGRVRPFVRYQYINASPRNVLYDDIGLRYGPSFGARFDLNDYLAFKAQLDNTSRRGLPDLSGLHFQVAATF